MCLIKLEFVHFANHGLKFVQVHLLIILFFSLPCYWLSKVFTRYQFSYTLLDKGYHLN